MFDQILSSLPGGSMEQRYLAMIALLDKAESLSNGASPELNVAIAQVKQRAINEFAARNKSETLDVIIARATTKEE
ncbi:hypothetical protein A3A84_01120 [Candidatus Collierbacteria bacterium RIFCSPLOWO2_01_FULL_50_23]|nr:MAG: hypothetical protein A3A84_01120 [Candidatus Collierbacteria bacterium RIFCSPLOWO2_01_FULL_50_23]